MDKERTVLPKRVDSSLWNQKRGKQKGHWNKERTARTDKRRRSGEILRKKQPGSCEGYMEKGVDASERGKYKTADAV